MLWIESAFRSITCHALCLCQTSSTSPALQLLAFGAPLLCNAQVGWPIALPLVESSHPGLHRHAKPVKAFDKELAELSRTMLQVMYDSGGIGLAGPQVGIDQSILVYNLFGQPLHLAATERVLINPRVIRSSLLRWTSPEGCLSLPEARGIVTRPAEVEVEAFELDGELIRQTLRGVEARVVLHEIDHLNGTP